MSIEEKIFTHERAKVSVHVITVIDNAVAIALGPGLNTVSISTAKKQLIDAIIASRVSAQADARIAALATKVEEDNRRDGGNGNG